MNNYPSFPTLKLYWSEVAKIIEDKVHEILGLMVCCQASFIDFDYWDVKATNYRFTTGDLMKLLSDTQASPETCTDTMAIDTDSCISLGMSLSSHLLRSSLNAGWELEHYTPKEI